MKRLVWLGMLACLPAITGCFDFTGELGRKREELTVEHDRLKREVRAAIALFNERDQLRGELNHWEARKEQIQQIIRGPEAAK